FLLEGVVGGSGGDHVWASTRERRGRRPTCCVCTGSSSSAGAGLSTRVSLGALVRIQVRSLGVKPPRALPLSDAVGADAMTRSNCSTSHSRRRACVGDRPF